MTCLTYISVGFTGLTSTPKCLASRIGPVIINATYPAVIRGYPLASRFRNVYAILPRNPLGSLLKLLKLGVFSASDKLSPTNDDTLFDRLPTYIPKISTMSLLKLPRINAGTQ